MELPVKNTSGQATGKIEVLDIVFDVPFNAALVHQVAMGHLANKRVGTHSTKTRGEVRGGGRKPWIQKHTGRARHVSIRSPQWRGGGVVFGPKPRDYHHATPRRMRRGAIRCMLAQRVREGAITVVEELNLDNHRTKEILNLLEALQVNTKSLVVSSDAVPALALACRNLRQIKSLPASHLNTLDLLDFDHVIMSVGAVRKVEEIWASDKRPVSSSQPESIDKEVAG